MQRIWSELGLRPHRVDTFKVSNDPAFTEKSQIQALDRTQTSRLTGKVIGQCLPRHRHEEFLKFLKTIDRDVPRWLQVHLILDNHSTHTHAEVEKWLKPHKRFHLHLTPTSSSSSSSWLNQVERWFRDLTETALDLVVS